MENVTECNSDCKLIFYVMVYFVVHAMLWVHPIKYLAMNIEVNLDKPLVPKKNALVGDKNLQTTTTKQPLLLNVCSPCSPTTIFVWFCDLVYVMLAVGIVQNICVNSNILHLFFSHIIFDDVIFSLITKLERKKKNVGLRKVKKVH